MRIYGLHFPDLSQAKEKKKKRGKKLPLVQTRPHTEAKRNDLYMYCQIIKIYYTTAQWAVNFKLMFLFPPVNENIDA